MTTGTHPLTHMHTHTCRAIAVAATVSDMAFYSPASKDYCFVNSSRDLNGRFKKYSFRISSCFVMGEFSGHLI